MANSYPKYGRYDIAPLSRPLAPQRREHRPVLNQQPPRPTADYQTLIEKPGYQKTAEATIAFRNKLTEANPDLGFLTDVTDQQLHNFFCSKQLDLSSIKNPEIFYLTAIAIIAFYKTNPTKTLNEYDTYFNYITSIALAAAELPPYYVSRPKYYHTNEAAIERYLLVQILNEMRFGERQDVSQLKETPHIEYYNDPNPYANRGYYEAATNTIYVNQAAITNEREFKDLMRHEITHALQTRFYMFYFIKEAAAENNTSSPTTYKSSRDLLDLMSYALDQIQNRSTFDQLARYGKNPEKAVDLFLTIYRSFAQNLELTLDILRTTTSYVNYEDTQAKGQLIPWQTAETLMSQFILNNLNNITPHSLARISNIYPEITGTEVPPELIKAIYSEAIHETTDLATPQKEPETTNTSDAGWKEFQESLTTHQTERVATIISSAKSKIGNFFSKKK